MSSLLWLGSIDHPSQEDSQLWWGSRAVCFWLGTTSAVAPGQSKVARRVGPSCTHQPTPAQKPDAQSHWPSLPIASPRAEQRASSQEMVCATSRTWSSNFLACGVVQIPRKLGSLKERNGSTMLNKSVVLIQVPRAMI
jgi:hypothetical protein